MAEKLLPYRYTRLSEHEQVVLEGKLASAHQAPESRQGRAHRHVIGIVRALSPVWRYLCSITYALLPSFDPFWSLASRAKKREKKKLCCAKIVYRCIHAHLQWEVCILCSIIPTKSKIWPSFTTTYNVYVILDRRLKWCWCVVKVAGCVYEHPYLTLLHQNLSRITSPLCVYGGSVHAHVCVCLCVYLSMCL